MTRWWWVRHGPTHAKAAIGWTDLPADLSDTVKLARLRAALPADAPVISSDLIRAKATADALDRERLPDTSALREMHYGDWEGLGFDEIATRWPDLSHAFWTTPGAPATPNGESWDGFSARVVAEIDRLNGQHRDIIAVAHMGVILAALAHATGLSPDRALAFEVANLSMTRLDYLPEPGVWRVGGVNLQL
ncbi:broad specificity phosphatase PhoE [Rubricella aquisinus]|uniref:Broad specificity phosphatase PhoE n=1 Tax=Rubricella aquisinus TaxID=2028108 RepID=A0A840X8A0_9RHOB|nr:histidine phosphatase family protein [Rubricella aquisinus]MBB5516947.1 broad specificity phosphatase PhoE [Rubricella aquisinus]